MGSATITVPLFTGGRISLEHRRGRGARTRRRRAGRGRRRPDLKLAVADVYVGRAAGAQGARGRRDSNVRTLEALVGDIAAMFERELVPKNELLAVQVALADARQNRLRAANGAEVALAVYNRRLGEPLDRAGRARARRCRPGDAAGGPGRRWWRWPRSGAPNSTRSMSRPRPTARWHASSARGVLPQVSVSGGYHYLENQFLDDETVGMAGVGVQWALFDGGQSRKRAAALERNRRATEEQRADVRVTDRAAGAAGVARRRRDAASGSA